MGLLSDRQIVELCKTQKMIDPFVESQIKSVSGNAVISYGVSSYGYDIRISNEYKIFTNAFSVIVDPKNFDPKAFVDFQGETCIIPPNSFVLCRSLEKFIIPDDVLVVTLGKSTYARCGLILNITPAEPGWRGFLTIEISNTTPLPARIYSYEGIGQLLFFRGEERPTITYGDRHGKYQNQVGVVTAKV